MANNIDIWITYLFDVFNLRLSCVHLFQNITVITAFISEETLVTISHDFYELEYSIKFLIWKYLFDSN